MKSIIKFFETDMQDKWTDDENKRLFGVLQVWGLF